MKDLENSDWIILDTSGNIYEIHANLTVMTLLTFNHFWILQAELCWKGTFVKAILVFFTIFRYLWKY